MGWADSDGRGWGIQAVSRRDSPIVPPLSLTLHLGKCHKLLPAQTLATQSILVLWKDRTKWAPAHCSLHMRTSALFGHCFCFFMGRVSAGSFSWFILRAHS